MFKKQINWDLARETNETLVGLYHAYWNNIYSPQVDTEFILKFSEGLQLVLEGEILEESELNSYLNNKGLFVESP